MELGNALFIVAGKTSGGGGNVGGGAGVLVSTASSPFMKTTDLFNMENYRLGQRGQFG